jgi:glutamine synthetase
LWCQNKPNIQFFMTTIRKAALARVMDRKPVKVTQTVEKISDIFGENVFGEEQLKNSVSSDVYKSLKDAIEKGEKIDAHLANTVAAGMKSWAISKGVTHFTHWFQPLTGSTAEKHDTFYQHSPNGVGMEHFKGSALVQQEPDASSFPHGGIRNTFEARGYTAWDPTSPAFIIENGEAKTLCIPTIFVSYTGEALDYKAPLLKASGLIEKAALAVVNEYFDKTVSKITTTLGVEQEYFLVDRALYEARPDLSMAGRTVFGHSPAKGQQLSDHYFGSIPQRVHTFMVDLETEAHKLGIPLATRHNEVSPGQFECAPTYEEINLAVDHNQLLMDLMNRVAEHHNLKVLFHEKPFAGVNGSGKHNNWSLQTDTGKNLLSPSSKAKENLMFLTFFVNTIKAVHEYNDLLRASIASAGNDHRLGAGEAPPAIMSVFIGSTLNAVLDELEQNGHVKVDKGDNVYMKLGINKIPPILRDNTDRNRTSPFAFTGNKFEFRAVGSCTNSASPMIVLNTIVADQLMKFKDEVDGLLKGGEKREMALIKVLRRYIQESKAIRFEGNGYSQAWAEEAARRGLSNLKTTPEALEVFLGERAVELFVKHGVFTDKEMEARLEIQFENYAKNIQIESRVMGDLAMNHVIPTAITYQNKLIENAKGLKEIGMNLDEIPTIDTIRQISKHISVIKTNVEEMIEARKRANKFAETDMQQLAKSYCNEVKPYFETIRYHVDKLELLIDDELWPLVKYRELLFLR